MLFPLGIPELVNDNAFRVVLVPGTTIGTLLPVSPHGDNTATLYTRLRRIQITPHPIDYLVLLYTTHLVFLFAQRNKALETIAVLLL